MQFCFDADDWLAIGGMFAAKGDAKKAAAAYQYGLFLDKNNGALLANMGAIAVHNRDWDAGEDFCWRALAVGPNAFACSSLAAIHLQRKERAEAYRCAMQSVQIRPDIPDHWMRLATAAQVNLDWGVAEDAYSKVMALFPCGSKPYAEAMTCLAIIKMTLGEWEEGLREYESRLVWKHPFPENTVPLWDGEPLRGKTVCFCLEQGIGDQIMCLRWVRYLIAEGAKVIMPGHPLIGQLVPMLKQDVTFIAPGNPVPEYDWFIPAMSMPYVLGKTYGLESAVSAPPYLSPPVVMRDGPRPTNLQVGLCWHGSPEHHNDRYRSMDLKDLQPILDVPGVDFVCLQHAEQEKKDALAAGMTVCNFGDRLDYMAETVGDLDLVISCDSMPAHLAGASGTPVWTLLPANPDFRWQLSGETTPLYSSMRLLRQAKMDDWTRPIAMAVDRLDEMVAERSVA